MLKCTKEVEIMTDYLIYALGALVFIGIFIIVIILINKKKQPKLPTYDVFAIAQVFDKNNIVAFEYIRNKMVVTFKDLSLFNVENLHALGAKNVSVVGDKVKFLMEEDREKNERIFTVLKDTIERS
jgi:phosphotransferase system IIB component